ncbi:MAG TPA: FHA domain-containing protein [Thermoanaerobaculia bacterium]|jgi:pSer/pThr/pTyr-binding forkhead associated (FHA) protein|nr:FHA domain-containing protein [Thermoanaerobaculia bacterium]
MSPILEGSLRHFPAGELLALLGGHGHSGLLEAEHRGRKARIWVREGRVAWAHSTDEAFDLPSLLSTYGLLTKEQFDTLRNGGPATEEHLNFHVSEIVFDLFTWVNGRFSFSEKGELPGDARELAIDPNPLIEEGNRRRAEALKVAQLYEDDSIRFRVIDDPASGSVSLTGEQFRILMRLGAGKTLGEVREELGRSEGDLYPVVKYLEEHGLIIPLPPPPSEEKTAEVQAPRAPLPSTSDKQAISRRTLVGSMTGDGPAAPCFPLLEDEYTIGREPSNKIALSDGSVSSRHARVYRTPEGFVLEDLKSRNGTFVNGEPVKEKRLLNDNDLVRIGKVILTFNLAKEQKAVDKTEPGKQ